MKKFKNFINLVYKLKQPFYEVKEKFGYSFENQKAQNEMYKDIRAENEKVYLEIKKELENIFKKYYPEIEYSIFECGVLYREPEVLYISMRLRQGKNELYLSIFIQKVYRGKNTLKKKNIFRYKIDYERNKKIENYIKDFLEICFYKAYNEKGNEVPYSIIKN